MNENRIIYIDESGDLTPLSKSDGATRFFTICAVIVNELDNPRFEAAVVDLESSGGGFKSSSIGSNDALRLKRAISIAQLPIKFAILAVDKERLVDAEWAKYRKTARKYFCRRLYQELHWAEGVNTFIIDEHGSQEYQESFRKYLAKKGQRSLFASDNTIEFADDAQYAGIRVADFLSGTLRRHFESDEVSPETLQVLDVLRPQQLMVRRFPEAGFSGGGTVERNPDDWSIIRALVEKAKHYVRQHEMDEDVALQCRAIVVARLLEELRDSYGGITKRSTAPELRALCKEKTRKNYGEQSFHQEIISGIRDDGIALAGSKSGYRLVTSIESFQEFADHDARIVLPMLRRLAAALDSVQLASLQSDILQGDSNREMLKRLLRSFSLGD